MEDTIVAPATPPVLSALALIRISGPQAHPIAQTLTGKPIPVGKAAYRNLVDGTTMLDDAILMAWKGPRSFTGEDVVEITCHGNPLIVARIQQAICQAGARFAEPGEFTRRAFLNGRMDLTQAEAVSELISAKSEKALDAVRRFQQGDFAASILDLREGLLQVLSHLEAAIDFPEEDISPQTLEELKNRTEGVRDAICGLLLQAQAGKLLRQGATVVLAGPTNAGKSSLMNALLGQDRVLVSEEAGTTRDSVDAEFSLDGFPIRLTDTAGLREPAGLVERQGMERTRHLLDQADCVLHIIDGTAPSTATALPPLACPVLLVANKSDLPGYSAQPPQIRVSARTGEGLSKLKRLLLNCLQKEDTSYSEQTFAINARHEHHLQEALKRLEAALDQLRPSAPAPALEVLSSDLRGATFALAEIVGEVSNEDVLDRLFQNFCIGK